MISAASVAGRVYIDPRRRSCDPHSKTSTQPSVSANGGHVDRQHAAAGLCVLPPPWHERRAGLARQPHARRVPAPDVVRRVLVDARPGGERRPGRARCQSACCPSRRPTRRAPRDLRGRACRRRPSVGARASAPRRRRRPRSSAAPSSRPPCHRLAAGQQRRRGEIAQPDRRPQRRPQRPGAGALPGPADPQDRRRGRRGLVAHRHARPQLHPVGMAARSRRGPAGGSAPLCDVPADRSNRRRGAVPRRSAT